VYRIKDDQGKEVEGFEEATRVITTYYEKLLGNKEMMKETVDRGIVQTRVVLLVEQ